MSEIRYPEFGELLRQARGRCGFSQAKLARLVVVSPNYCGYIERGLKLMSLPLFARMWQALEFNADELLDTLPVTVGETRKRLRPEATSIYKGDVEGEHIAFGRLIATARRKAQITQAELGQAIGIARRQLNRIENGHTLPSLPRFAALRQVLGFDANELLAQLCNPDLRATFYGFGRVIELARIGLSMSPEHVAHAAGCELAYYRNIERGAVLPTIRVAVSIHRVISFDANAALRWVWQTDALESAGDQAD